MLGPRRQTTGNGWWLMFSLGVEEAGGEEEDAGKKGGMDGGSGEPLTSAAWCPSLHVRGGRSTSSGLRSDITGTAGGHRRSTTSPRPAGCGSWSTEPLKA